MPIDDQALAAVEQLLSDLSRRDISHEELGSQGFQDGQEQLFKLYEYIYSLLERLNKFQGRLNDELVNEVLGAIRSSLKEIVPKVEEIDTLAKDIGQIGDYGKRRDQALRWIHNTSKDLIKRIQPLDHELQLLEIKESLESEGFRIKLSAMENELAEVTKKAQSSVEELQHMVAAGRGKVTEKSVDTASSSFSDLQDGHRTMAIAWFLALLVFGICIAVLVGDIYGADWNTGNWEDWAPDLIRRVVAISFLVAAVRVCLTKFNAERNLQIVYKHRHRVLDQYSTFDSAIGDDEEAKSQLRLEIARIIFSDPITGYIADKDGTELNINPVIGMMDRIASK